MKMTDLFMVLLGFIIVLSVTGIGIYLHSDYFTSPSAIPITNPPEIRSFDRTIFPEQPVLNLRTPIGAIIIQAPVPESPVSVPYYKLNYTRNDVIHEEFASYAKIRHNETPANIAPALAEQYLEPHGGIPDDAVMVICETSYGYSIDPVTREVVERDPIFTIVSYKRAINGTLLKGMGDGISVHFGENGEVLGFSRVWGKLEYLERSVPVISVEKAIEKLERRDPYSRDVMNMPRSFATATVHDIYLTYYGHNWTYAPEIYLEPVWVLNATFDNGNRYEFYIYARQFANFTATPTSGKTPLTVNFTDMSDASPNQWHWDFGDGTNSTERNPAHTYTSAGAYNVSLRAWNDLGSDTMEVPFLITVRDPAPPVANFTGSPAIGPAPLTVSFNDTSTNIPTGWTWDFGDETNATVQNPVHTYSTPGNYTVSLNATNDDGTGVVVKPDYITVTNLPPTTITTQPTTTVTTTATTTVTTTVTTTTTTTPTPTKTQAPLSAVVPVVGILVAGMVSLMRLRNGG